MKAPAAPATEYVPVYFRAGFTGDESPYQGWPNDEKDELWQELYHHGVTLRISADEHKSLVNQTIRVPIAGYENDYFGGLDVFHQLHCLNQIRMGYYPRRYNTSMTNPDGTVSYDQWLHIDHCIESLRQSIMCHSDIGFNTFKWLDDKKITQPMLNDMHMCRNFDKIREWAFDRYVSLDNRRAHVENGVLVDYSSWGPDPDSLLEGVVPKGWNYTVDDL
ncbi:tat pathway signal sequence [Cercophora newfieldiana]|uniref:Tat pathway signal sequence n=1 Tax=Cercophora newfieldiana TaxID=92897 RepID=A0AA39YHE0_9PEZI|nr:tat pathway signal sequence [Cercophora newfieldiana]